MRRHALNGIWVMAGKVLAILAGWASEPDRRYRRQINISGASNYTVERQQVRDRGMLDEVGGSQRGQVFSASGIRCLCNCTPDCRG